LIPNLGLTPLDRRFSRFSVHFDQQATPRLGENDKRGGAVRQEP